MYTYDNIGAMDKMCPAAQMAGLGTVVDKLIADIADDKKYSGSLLTADKINALNKMCSGGEKVQLGTLVNNILTASKNGTTVATISDATKNIINGMCMGATLANLGGVLQGAVTTINTHGVISDLAEITAFTVTGQIGDALIDRGEFTIALTMPFESVVTALVPTFTVSEGATVKIGEVAQVSGETANDFTADVEYIVTSASGDVINTYTVTVTVAEASTATDILTFIVPSQTGDSIIDNDNHTIAIDMPFGSDVTALAATFTLSDGAIAKIGETEQVSGTTENDFTGSIAYTIVAEDATTTQEWTVTITVLELTDTDFLTYGTVGAGETNVVIDDANHTISLDVPFGTDVSGLVATFTLSEGATAKVGEVAQESGITLNNFSLPVTYIVTAGDTITTQEWTITFTILPE